MMGWGVILEQEVAPSEDGADTLLRRFAHLEWRKKQISVLNSPPCSNLELVLMLSDRGPLVCCAL